jgi:hypothetical protein
MQATVWVIQTVMYDVGKKIIAFENGAEENKAEVVE